MSKKLTYILLSIGLLLSAGCFTSEKFRSEFDKGNRKFPDVAADLCNDNFPNVLLPSTTNDAALKAWKDSVKRASDSAMQAGKQFIHDSVPVFRTDTIYTCADSVKKYQEINSRLTQKVSECKGIIGKNNEYIATILADLDNAPHIIDSVPWENTKKIAIAQSAAEKAIAKQNKQRGWLIAGWVVAGVMFLLLLLCITIIISKNRKDAQG